MANQSNLPEWSGAAVVYARCYLICESLNLEAYRSQRGGWRRKTGFRFTPDPEADAIIAAMNVGDEEALKAAAYQHRRLWQAEGAAK